MTAGAPVTAAVLRKSIADRCDALERELDSASRTLAAKPVHKTRVAARSLRSLLATLKPLLHPARRRRLQRELRDLAVEFEAVRTADVRREWLDRLATDSGVLPPGAHNHLVLLLEDAQSTTRRELHAHLQAAAFDERRERILRGLHDPRLLQDARDDLRTPVRRRLDKRWKRLRKALRHCRHEDASTLHELRLAAKHARYASDALLPLLGRDPRPATRRLKRLQDCLGEHRDACEALDWLARLDAPQGAVLQARLQAPIRKVLGRRMSEFRRLVRALEMPDPGVPGAATVSRAQPRPVARSARS